MKKQKPFTLKTLNRLFKEASKYRDNRTVEWITSESVFNAFDNIVNAPWYKKLWWRIKYTVEDIFEHLLEEKE